MVFNQIVCNIPMMTAVYFIMQSRGLPDVETLPTLNKVNLQFKSFITEKLYVCSIELQMIVDFFVFLLIEDMGFYYTHRYINYSLNEIKVNNSSLCKIDYFTTHVYTSTSTRDIMNGRLQWPSLHFMVIH